MSLVANRKRCALSLGLAWEKDHVPSATKELVSIAGATNTYSVTQPGGPHHRRRLMRRGVTQPRQLVLDPLALSAALYHQQCDIPRLSMEIRFAASCSVTTWSGAFQSRVQTVQILAHESKSIEKPQCEHDVEMCKGISQSL